MHSKFVPTSSCVFCKGVLRLQHRGARHPFKKDHGFFDIYICRNCGSCQTNPLPSPESLAALYGSYCDGLPDLHRTITADDPQTALYKKCASRIDRLLGKHRKSTFSWLDVGAGGGEFSTLLANRFPNSSGTAIDLHSCSNSLKNITNVDWFQVDINHPEFASNLSRYDLIVSIAVLEHVLYPNLFIANLLQLLRPGGLIYLLCPNNASWASWLLGRRWPYFTPGEHLAIPTPIGVTRCLEREWCLLYGLDNKVKINAGSLMLPYTLRYVMRRLGANSIGRLLPPGLGFSLPVGALETVVICQQLTLIGAT